jgi:Lipocalin-like domain
MQNMSIRGSLIGTWQLVSYQAQDADGRISYPLGKNLLGLLCYTDQGFMSVQVMKPERPNYSSGDLHVSSTEEMAAAANGYIAYAGPFSTDEAAGTVTHHVKLSLSPSRVGSDQTRFVTISADCLYLSAGPVLINGSLRAPHTVWARVQS